MELCAWDHDIKHNGLTVFNIGAHGALLELKSLEFEKINSPNDLQLQIVSS